MPNESHPLPDEIHIEQLEVFTRIGVLEEERANPQRLTVSISLWPYEKTGGLADNIEQTVNYSAVAEETKNFVRDQSLNLIETLADRLAMHLLKTFPPLPKDVLLLGTDWRGSLPSIQTRARRGVPWRVSTFQVQMEGEEEMLSFRPASKTSR